MVYSERIKSLFSNDCEFTMHMKPSKNKILYLLRHAKSSWNDHTLSDFERPLNKRGTSQLPEIAAVLTAKQHLPQVIISSPANRAFSTAKIMAISLCRDENEIGSEKRVYEATFSNLIYLLQETADEIDCLLLVGHNPGLSNLVNVLSKQKTAPLPTCALVELHLDIESWTEVAPECAELVALDVPTKE